ncbi:MAG: CapA family protein [Pseudomonadota bacterium]
MAEPEFVKSLKQPENLDSKAAQYLQLRLQKEIFRARPTVTANRNSQEYFADPIAKTTSYIVQVYSPEPLQVEAAEHYWFAGDTFFGRYVEKSLLDSKGRHKLVEDVLRTTGGEKLIVNLEGVVAKECPENPGLYKLCMKTDVTVQTLKALNVTAVNLANNHNRDEGNEAYTEMKRLLTNCGITVLENRSITDFGRFRLAALTDVDNSEKEKYAVLRQHDLVELESCPRDKPIFAFVHWGREYSGRPGPRETALGSALHGSGAELIIGCHSHKSGKLSCQLGSCGIFSLGNFIFDQIGAQVSGQLLHVMFFPQGTYFLKAVDIENFYNPRGRH